MTQRAQIPRQLTVNGQPIPLWQHCGSTVAAASSSEPGNNNAKPLRSKERSVTGLTPSHSALCACYVATTYVQRTTCTCGLAIWSWQVLDHSSIWLFCTCKCLPGAGAHGPNDMFSHSSTSTNPLCRSIMSICMYI